MPQREPLLFLAILLAAPLLLLLQVVWPFFTSFLLASVLAIVVSPGKQWLVARLHRPGLATFTDETLFFLITWLCGYKLPSFCCSN